MKYRNSVSQDYLQFNNLEINTVKTYKGIMYHGTDKNVLRMNKHERDERNELCRRMADFAYEFLQTKNVCVVLQSALREAYRQRLEDIWYSLRNYGMTRYEGAKRNNTLYQYGLLYVTNNFDRAADYARSSYIFGERGNVAYWLYKGATRFDDFYDCDSIRRDVISEFENTLKVKHEPIVVCLENIEKSDIKNENGTSVDWALFEEHYINNDIIESFRIANSGDYDLSSMRYVDILN